MRPKRLATILSNASLVSSWVPLHTTSSKSLPSPSWHVCYNLFNQDDANIPPRWLVDVFSDPFGGPILPTSDTHPVSVLLLLVSKRRHQASKKMMWLTWRKKRRRRMRLLSLPGSGQSRCVISVFLFQLLHPNIVRIKVLWMRSIDIASIFL